MTRCPSASKVLWSSSKRLVVRRICSWSPARAALRVLTLFCDFSLLGPYLARPLRHRGIHVAQVLDARVYLNRPGSTGDKFA